MANRVLIKGYLGKDPQFKEVAGGEGKVLCHFSIATTLNRKPEITEWFNCNIYSKVSPDFTTIAERAAEELKKGDFIWVEGILNAYIPDGSNDKLLGIVVDDYIRAERREKNSLPPGS
jgi:single-stranded DNA-binding protein